MYICVHNIVHILVCWGVPLLHDYRFITTNTFITKSLLIEVNQETLIRCMFMPKHISYKTINICKLPKLYHQVSIRWQINAKALLVIQHVAVEVKVDAGLSTYCSASNTITKHFLKSCPGELKDKFLHHCYMCLSVTQVKLYWNILHAWHVL